MNYLELKNAPGHVAVVDDEDFPRLSKWDWLLAHGYDSDDLVYVVRFENKKAIQLHRVVLGAADGQIVDHKDRNGLNNQKSNLRLCSHTQNMQNRKKHRNGHSRFKGIWQKKGNGSWVTQIIVNKKKISIYGFSIEEDAARAYDSLAKEHFGEFARLNFAETTVQALF